MQEQISCLDIKPLVYLLVILFGVSSWVDINGLWVELPVLVMNLPEAWDLPSYMVLVIQIANIAPFVYTVSNYVWPRKSFEVPVSYTIISIGAISCLLLSFFWDSTTYVFGAERSTALLVLNFCLALVDCTSSVAFLPFMHRFKSQYMTAYFIGEGFSGLVPSLASLGQGAGSMECVNVTFGGSGNSTSLQNITDHKDTYLNGTIHNSTGTPGLSFAVYPSYLEPNFSVQVFFIILTLLVVASGISFGLLNNWPYCKTEMIDSHDNAICTQNKSSVELKGFSFDSPYIETSQSHVKSKETTNEETKTKIETQGISEFEKMSKEKYFLFLIYTAVLNGVANGVLPSLQTYSALSYGIQPYHLAVNLSVAANPIACFATLFLCASSVLTGTILTVLSLLLSTYLIVTASMSPDPPLVQSTSGAPIIILAWTVTMFLITYTKVCIATLFRLEDKRALLWVGAFTQIGSLIGALTTFFLVNHYKLFRDAQPC